MSELAREIIPIAVMYGFVLLLAPFIGIAMWMAFDGDRDRTAAPPVEAEMSLAEPAETQVTQVPTRAGEALGAA